MRFNCGSKGYEDHCDDDDSDHPFDESSSSEVATTRLHIDEKSHPWRWQRWRGGRCCAVASGSCPEKEDVFTESIVELYSKGSPVMKTKVHYVASTETAKYISWYGCSAGGYMTRAQNAVGVHVEHVATVKLSMQQRNKVIKGGVTWDRTQSMQQPRMRSSVQKARDKGQAMHRRRMYSLCQQAKKKLWALTLTDVRRRLINEKFDVGMESLNSVTHVIARHQSVSFHKDATCSIRYF